MITHHCSECGVEVDDDGACTLHPKAQIDSILSGTVLICTNDRYCPSRDTFATVEEFERMCREVFGDDVHLTHQPLNGSYVDERGEVVLVEGK